MRNKLLLSLALSIVALCFGMANPALATPVGNLNVANCGGGGVTVTINTITWLPAGTLPGTGCIDTGAGTSVVFSGGTLLPGVLGNVENLVFAPGSVDNFMTFPAVLPTLDFVLTGVGPGSANTTCTGLALNASCSVFAGSPFVLTNVGGGNTGVGFAVQGTVSDATGTAEWHGLFTTQLPEDAGTIQTTILTPGGSITTTHSGSFTVSAVPEPSTVLILGSGLLLVGLAVFRRQTISRRS